MEKIKELVKKICTKEVILYIVFGIFTTAINLCSFYVMNTLWDWEENFIAIILAVLFAYITNKDLVFHSNAKGIREKLAEFIKFIAGRAFTMVIEFVGGWILFQTIIPQMISKCIVTVVVIILNFFISKFFAFKGKKRVEH